MARTLISDTIKNVYQKLVFYLSSDNKLYKTLEDGSNTDVAISVIDNDLTLGGEMTDLTAKNGIDINAQISGDSYLNFKTNGVAQGSFGHDFDEDKIKLTSGVALGGTRHLEVDSSSNLLVEGKVSAATPTSNSDLTTKLYVDDAPGSILGYTNIGEDSIHQTYNLTESYAVPSSATKVAFRAPESGNVEIEVQVFFSSVSTNRSLFFGLSSSSSYVSLGAEYEHVVYYADRAENTVITNKWTVTGLSAGNHEIYLGAKIDSVDGDLNWGGNSSGRFCDFIMKAVALP